MNDEEREASAKSMFDEFLSGGDTAEALTCARELSAPGAPARPALPGAPRMRRPPPRAAQALAAGAISAAHKPRYPGWIAHILTNRQPHVLIHRALLWPVRTVGGAGQARAWALQCGAWCKR